MTFYNSYMISYILDNLVVILSAFISYLISILNYTGHGWLNELGSWIT
jgi:hypothetical protein